MKAAWSASIAAQALLALTLYRAGQRDWWTLYLAAGVVESAILWPLRDHHRIAYYWVWAIGLALLTFLQFVAILNLSPAIRPHSFLTFTLAGFAASFWLVALLPIDWPVYRQAANIGWLLSSIVCLSGVAAFGQLKSLMGAYYCVQALLSSLVHLSSSQTWVGTAGLIQQLIMTALFSIWIVKSAMNRNAYA